MRWHAKDAPRPHLDCCVIRCIFVRSPHQSTALMFERDLVNLPQEPSCRRVQFGLSALELELRTYAWIHIQGVGLILKSHRPVKTALTVEVLPHRFELIPSQVISMISFQILETLLRNLQRILSIRTLSQPQPVLLTLTHSERKVLMRHMHIPG